MRPPEQTADGDVNRSPGSLRDSPGRSYRGAVIQTSHVLADIGHRRPLEAALLMNGTFSGACGFGLMMFAEQLNEWAGFRNYVDDWVTFGAGLMLALYALMLYVSAMRPRISRNAVAAVIMLDAGWAAGTLPLTVLQHVTPAGAALVVVLAVVVGMFGVAQRKALRAYAADADLLMAESLRAASFGRIGQSWLGMKTWIKVWLFGLNAVFIAGIAFLDRGHLSQWILLAYVASGPYLFAFMVAQKGLSRVLGVAHIVPWTALLALALVRIGTDSTLGPQISLAGDFSYALYLYVLVAALIFSLAFDYYDLYRWIRGDRFVLGSEAAARAGACKPMFA